MMDTWGPDGQELIAPGNMLAAIRSAPWAVWAGAVLLVAQWVVGSALEPRISSLILLPVGVLFPAAVLAGIRVLWQVAIVLEIGSVFFAFAPHNSIWAAAVGAGALVFLLLSSSRRYFRPGRMWLPRRVRGMSYDDWEKGARRYLALKEAVPRYVAPREVMAFFVACRGRGRLSTLSPVFRREYVIAATDDGLVVLRMHRPAIVRSTFTGIVSELRADDPALSWDAEAFVVDGRDYRPIQHHERDADQVAQWLHLARENPRK
jgi:hypothetical protein